MVRSSASSVPLVLKGDSLWHPRQQAKRWRCLLSLRWRCEAASGCIASAGPCANGVCPLLPVLHGRNGRKGSRHQPGIIPGGAAGGLKESGGTIAGPSGFLLRECGPIGSGSYELGPFGSRFCFQLPPVTVPKVENPYAFRLAHVLQTQLADFLLTHSRKHSDQGQPEFLIPNDMRPRLRPPVFGLATRPDRRLEELL